MSINSHSFDVGAIEGKSNVHGFDALCEQFIKCSSSEDKLKSVGDDMYLYTSILLDTAQNKSKDKRFAINLFDCLSGKGKNLSLALVMDDMHFILHTFHSCISTLGLDVEFITCPSTYVLRDKDGKITALSKTQNAANEYTYECFIYCEFKNSCDHAEYIHDFFSKCIEIVISINNGFAGIKNSIASLIKTLTSGDKELDHETQRYISILKWFVDDRSVLLSASEYAVDKDGKRIPDGKWVEHGWQASKSGCYILDQAFINYDFIDTHGIDKPFLSYSGLRSPIHNKRDVYVLSHVFKKIRYTYIFTLSLNSESKLNTDIPLFSDQASKIINMILNDHCPSHMSCDTSHYRSIVNRVVQSYPKTEFIDAEIKHISYNISRIVDTFMINRNYVVIRKSENGNCHRIFVIIYRTEIYNKNEIFPNMHDIETTLEEKIGGTVDPNFSKRNYVGDGNQYCFYFMLTDISKKFLPINDYDKIAVKIKNSISSWKDKLHMQLADLKIKFSNAVVFPSSYQKINSIEGAIYDIQNLTHLIDKRSIYAAIKDNRSKKANKITLSIYSIKKLDLYWLVKCIDAMGFYIFSTENHDIIVDSKPCYMVSCSCIINDNVAHAIDVNICVLKQMDHFNDVLAHVYEHNYALNDLLSLAIGIHANYREIMIVNGYVEYLIQLDSSLALEIRSTISKHPIFIRKLLDFFLYKFSNYSHDSTPITHEERLKVIENIKDEICDIVSPERFSSTIEYNACNRLKEILFATVRSNFSLNNSYISFKIKTGKINFIATTITPYIETWVYSDHFTGIHIRFDSVSRGGIRWSEREDFRNEIMDLARAQRFKNALITPEGAKGGFLVKSDMKVLDAYKLFISGLIEVVDNEGVPYCNIEYVDPSDRNDNYLVVAADKGTATYSDHANALSVDVYKFWLGDAFASGGSNGYDHKAMGITAKGAWECCVQHFYEMGVDCNNEAITCVGVGDMGGDVFGNGLLRSKHTKLLAAFNHKHIFLDPTPDPAKSYQERQRLFDKCYGWDKYNELSPGGMIIERSHTSVTLTKQAKKLLSLTCTKTSPDVIMVAILEMKVDLMWFGGIGTYIRSSSEDNVSISDHKNDSIRVPSTAIRASVIGEGANLAMTQLARIECDQLGVRLNTDFIDNAAGVNTSDHEVNIKIALAAAEKDKVLDRKHRNALLAKMQDSVMNRVLVMNRMQAVSISFSQNECADITQVNALISTLESACLLNRKEYFIPLMADLKNRHNNNASLLTRPELSRILSSLKLYVYRELVAGDISSAQSVVQRQLILYFPEALHTDEFLPYIEGHMLKDRIALRGIINEMVNYFGIFLIYNFVKKYSISPKELVLSYVLVRDVLDLKNIVEYIVYNNDIKYSDKMNIFIAINNFTVRFITCAYHLIQDSHTRDIDKGLVHKYKTGLNSILDLLLDNKYCSETIPLVMSSVSRPLKDLVCSDKTLQKIVIFASMDIDIFYFINTYIKQHGQICERCPQLYKALICAYNFYDFESIIKFIGNKSSENYNASIILLREMYKIQKLIIDNFSKYKNLDEAAMIEKIGNHYIKIDENTKIANIIVHLNTIKNSIV